MRCGSGSLNDMTTLIPRDTYPPYCCAVAYFPGMPYILGIIKVAESKYRYLDYWTV
jgi:hypothetical protein